MGSIPIRVYSYKNRQKRLPKRPCMYSAYVEQNPLSKEPYLCPVHTNRDLSQKIYQKRPIKKDPTKESHQKRPTKRALCVSCICRHKGHTKRALCIFYICRQKRPVKRALFESYVCRQKRPSTRDLPKETYQKSPIFALCL